MGRVPRPSKPITDSELQILRIIWAAGSCTMRDVHDALNSDRPIAKTTIASQISTMEERGLITPIDDRRPKVYKAAVEQESIAGSMVTDVLRRVYGALTSGGVLKAFSHQRLDPKVRKAVQDELDKLNEP